MCPTPCCRHPGPLCKGRDRGPDVRLLLARSRPLQPTNRVPRHTEKARAAASRTMELWMLPNLKPADSATTTSRVCHFDHAPPACESPGAPAPRHSLSPTCVWLPLTVSVATHAVQSITSSLAACSCCLARGCCWASAGARCVPRLAPVPAALAAAWKPLAGVVAPWAPAQSAAR